jgi:N-acetyl-1-D-myo-inositol-2-amino-2-deoxy-alpha-D-glucopyranoside deacetylase
MNSEAPADRRMMLVHAHPDDESIQNGATMAKYASEGADVTLVTCTLGEQGEVLVPSLTHLAADKDDLLGQHRIGELTDAMAILGVKDFRFLGGPGHYRDTGMEVDEDDNAIPPAVIRPDSFWAADLTEAARLLVEMIREVRPQVLIAYDEHGGYGHPDHIQAHRVAMYASALAAAPSFAPELGEAWDIAKIYWTSMSENKLRNGLRLLRESGDTTMFEGMDPDGPLPYFVVPDTWLTSEIDGVAFLDQKMAAMKAHATQIEVDGPFFALSNNLGQVIWGTECYRLVKGRVGATDGPDGHETDLFSGVA